MRRKKSIKRIITLLSIPVLVMLFCVACVGANESSDTTNETNNVETVSSEDLSEKVYTVTYKDSANGTILGETQQLVKYGKAASSVRAVPDKGYVFVTWSDGIKTATRKDKMITSNLTVSPIFAKQEEKEIIMSDGVPVIHIKTVTGTDVTSKEIYVKCSVSLDGAEDVECFEEATAQIRGRGNSSWGFEKKSYRLKFDTKRSMLSSDYKAKDWTLIANHCDKSLSRNAIAHELASQFDAISFSSMHRFVEVYMNGEYAGVYLLCDQIETGKGRVDVSEEFTDDGDTGYLVELDARADQEATWDVDKFILSNDSGHYYRLRTPDVDDPNYDPDIYLSYIKKYMEDSMYAINDLKDWEKIQEYIDVESFAEAYIVYELMANLDCHAFSFYMYKEKGGKLYCGPVWDFDISSGNNNYGYGQEEGSITDAVPDLDMQVYEELWVAKQNRWFRRLLRIQEFEALVTERLEKYENIINKVYSLLDTEEDKTQSYYSLYGEAMERNFERWNIMGVYIWPNTERIVNITTVKGQIDYLQDWLLERHDIVRARFGLGKSGV